MRTTETHSNTETVTEEHLIVASRDVGSADPGTAYPERSGATPFPELDTGIDFGSVLGTHDNPAESPLPDNAVPIQDDGSFTAPALIADELDMVLLAPDEPILEGMDHFFHLKDVPGNYQSRLLGPEILDSRTEVLTPVTASAPSFLAAGSLSNVVGSLVPIPDRFIGPLSPSPDQRISSSCSRFILSIIRTYPRMMTGPRDLPPFIHPVGCG
ncbi:hypothetical protein IMZ48_03605, partial [Candidatus Bathyarchaeota archaeon]|nr:hypothetical protein [Candidatus Bathyarchaeota archaeon]